MSPFAPIQAAGLELSFSFSSAAYHLSPLVLKPSGLGCKYPLSNPSQRAAMTLTEPPRYGGERVRAAAARAVGLYPSIHPSIHEPQSIRRQEACACWGVGGDLHLKGVSENVRSFMDLQSSSWRLRKWRLMLLGSSTRIPKS